MLINRLKYATSRTIYLLLRPQEMKLHHILIALNYIPSFLILIGLGLGLYSRWSQNHYPVILCLAFIGLFVFIISFAAQYYFSIEHLSICSHLWFGCLLGFISLSEVPHSNDEQYEDIMGILFMSALCAYCIFSFLTRITKIKPKDNVLLTYVDISELIGMAISTLLIGTHFFSLVLLVVALGILIVGIRLRCFIAFLNLIILILLTHYLLFPMLKISPNPYALVCFIGQRTIEPTLDLYFSSHSKLELWQRFIFQNDFWRKINTLIIVILELAYFISCTLMISTYSEWYMILLFSLFSIIWFCFHISLIITLWSLMQQITASCKLYSPVVEQANKMIRILASRGIKHFSLISKNHVLISALTTAIISALCWTKTTEVVISIALIVFTVEILFFDLLNELGSALGGTAIIYSLIVSSVPNRSDGNVGLLPPDILLNVNDRMTSVLKNIHLFISYHLLSNFGCDFSTSGITSDVLETKMRSFFGQKIEERLAYDTYIIYFSGPVHNDGNWALLDGKSFTLDTLHTIWKEVITTTDSRLILILDSSHSYKWLPLIKSIEADRIALQTVSILLLDPEMGSSFNVGDFTTEWVSCNCSEDSTDTYQGNKKGLKALFAVTWNWTDFSVRQPSWEDINHHIDKKFPKFTHFFLKTMNWPLNCDCWCFRQCIRWFKSYRMLKCPPKDLDTGHGFKLIYS